MLDKVFAGMAESFSAEKAAGQQAVVQYEIAAPDGAHEYAMRIADGRCEIDKGQAESPRVTIRLGLADFLRLITGNANGMQLFMTGKLKVSGDLFFAQTYQSWFDRPQAWRGPARGSGRGRRRPAAGRAPLVPEAELGRDPQAGGVVGRGRPARGRGPGGARPGRRRRRRRC